MTAFAATLPGRSAWRADINIVEGPAVDAGGSNGPVGYYAEHRFEITSPPRPDPINWELLTTYQGQIKLTHFGVAHADISSMGQKQRRR